MRRMSDIQTQIRNRENSLDSALQEREDLEHERQLKIRELEKKLIEADNAITQPADSFCGLQRYISHLSYNGIEIPLNSYTSAEVIENDGSLFLHIQTPETSVSVPVAVSLKEEAEAYAGVLRTASLSAEADLAKAETAADVLRQRLNALQNETPSIAEAQNRIERYRRELADLKEEADARKKRKLWAGFFACAAAVSLTAGLILRFAGRKEQPVPEPEPVVQPDEEPVIPDGPIVIVTEPDDIPESDEIRPEIKQAIDEVEQFFDEYLLFIERFEAADSDQAFTMLSEYLDYLTGAAETLEKIENMDTTQMNEAEKEYYYQALQRISEKLGVILEHLNLTEE